MLDREFEQYLENRGGAVVEKTKGQVLWAITIAIVAAPVIAYIIKLQ